MAEDLLLLVTDDASGRLSAPAAQVDAGLGGANLVELTLRNKVDLSGEGDQGKPGRIIVRDPSPAGDAVLDAALEIIIAHQGKKPSTVIRPLSKNLRQSLYQRLADGGVVRAEQGRILGVFPTHRWPAQDASHEAEVRRLVTQPLRSSPSCTRSGARTRSSTPGNTACPNESSERGRRRSPRATGHPRPSARRSRRWWPQSWPPLPPPPSPPPPGRPSSGDAGASYVRTGWLPCPPLLASGRRRPPSDRKQTRRRPIPADAAVAAGAGERPLPTACAE
jgi:hypothetical protein